MDHGDPVQYPGTEACNRHADRHDGSSPHEDELYAEFPRFGILPGAFDGFSAPRATLTRDSAARRRCTPR